MTSLITCPACQYTRKPTDDAPDWACPQCQKAYAKTAMQRDGFCKNHPSIMSNWRCNDCGAEFCGDCVKSQIHSGSTSIASCPECKGLCINIKSAETPGNKEREKSKMWKRWGLAYLGLQATLPAMILGLGFNYYCGYKHGEADARRELPAATWHRWTVLDPKDDPPVKEMPVVQHGGGFKMRFKMRVKGYVAGHNAVVKEWLVHNRYAPPPPISKEQAKEGQALKVE